MQRMASTRENDRAADRSVIEQRIAANLARFVEDSGYSQNQVADMSGIPQATLGRYMRGENAPPADALGALAQVLGRSVDDFYRRDPPPQKKREQLEEENPMWLRHHPGVDLTEEDLANWEKFISGVKERRAKKLTVTKKKPEK